MKFLFLTLLLTFFLIGCTSKPIKQKPKKVELPKYSGICYSENQEEYIYSSGIKITKINQEGIFISVDKNDPFLLNKSCILERNGIKFSKLENNGNFIFSCVFDEVGDNFFLGRNYQIVKVFNDGDIIQLFNPKLNKEIIIQTENCQIYKNDAN